MAAAAIAEARPSALGLHGGLAVVPSLVAAEVGSIVSVIKRLQKKKAFPEKLQTNM